MTFSLTEVSFRYPRSTRNVLHRLSADFPAGSATAILGPNGAGKSTLLGLLGLLWDRGPSDGRITFRPHDAQPVTFDDSLPHADRVRFRGRHFGFVLQTGRLLSSFTCRQNIELPLTLGGETSSVRRRRVSELIEAVDRPAGTFAGVADRYPHQVSGGERQRVTVLRAIAHRPRVLFADEPANHLDPPATDHVAALIGGWQRGEFTGSDTRPRTLILITHDVALACRLATRFLFLGRGFAETVVPAGSPDPHAIRVHLDRVCQRPAEGVT